MARRLNPYQQLLWRNPNTAQIGLGPSAVTLAGVTKEQQRFIDALYYGFGESQVDAMAAQSKLPSDQAEALLAQLEPMLIEDHGAGQRRGKLELGSNPSGLALGELVRASLLRGYDGQSVLAARHSDVIYLESLDKTGLLLCQVLAAAGVGYFIIGDADTVSRTDLGNDGYPRGLLGQDRIDAAQRILDAIGGTAKLVPLKGIRTSQLHKVTLAIFSAQQVIDPKPIDRWVKRGTPLLGITFESEGATVSAVLRNNFNGCFRCEHLNRSTLDAHWPEISSQLLASELRFDDAVTRSVAVGLAAQNALAFLDTQNGFGETDSNGMVYRTETKSLVAKPYQWNSTCDCRALLEQMEVA